jgi:hypothetical protein
MGLLDDSARAFQHISLAQEKTEGLQLKCEELEQRCKAHDSTAPEVHKI